MKTIKRHLPAALLLLALTGCAIDESYQVARTEEKQITIKAIREDGDTPETRTVRNDKGKVYWSKGDQISLFYGHGTDGGSIFTSTQEDDTVKVTNFIGTITAITGGGEISENDTYFWGLYPYNETASCDGSYITTTLPSHQVAYPGSYAPGTNISVGRSQGLTMGFYNACGGFRFSLNKEGVKKVTFKGKNGENLVGKLKISFVNGKVNTEILEGENEVVLEAPAGEYFEPGVLYYFVLAPTVLSNGFTVKAETFTEETTFSYDSSITIEASNFKSKKLMDTGLTWTQKTGNIPIEDANFKAYLVSNFDGNGDGEISYEEAAVVTAIKTATTDISSLYGIECMVNLTKLDVYNSFGSGHHTLNPDGSYSFSASNPPGNLSSIDVSNNKELTYLSCSYNQLTSLDVSNNTELLTLNCKSNHLKILDITNNTSMTRLDCSYNELKNLDITMNTSLLDLRCGNNQLTSLDVSSNTKIEILYINQNNLASIDLSNNSALIDLNVYNNQLISLDLSSNTALTNLNCNNNQLTSLDVSNNTVLTDLWCFNNQITDLDVSNNTALSDFRCGPNQLRNLDVSNNAALFFLVCSHNLLTSLDVSNNSELGTLKCDHNYISTLNVSNNPALYSLDCSFMNDPNGRNLLSTLYISDGQEIPYITSDRSINFIPPETEIKVYVDNGGGEDNSDDEL